MNNKQIKRSKSLSSLAIDVQSYEEFTKELGALKSFCKPSSSRNSGSGDSSASVDVEVVNDSESETFEGAHDSGIGGEVFVILEQKIDRLRDLFLDQCKLMTDIKSEVRNSRAILEKSELAQNKLVVELLKKALEKSRTKQLEDDPERESFNSRARSLLAAIETRQASCLDDEIRDALVDFLQSDDLRAHMVSATVESVRDMIRCNFTRDVSVMYLPLLERSQRQLARHVARALETAFVELEDHSASFSNSIYKTTRSLRHALERHQTLIEESVAAGSNRLSYLQYAVEEVFQNELKLWRQEAVATLYTMPTEAHPEALEADSPHPLDYPLSPQQPADPECSIIDQLMKSAEISKQISDGDVNGAFERALSAGDLSLVMTACRAADPASLFAPPGQLKQSVLLSLAQQLATDMVHDTQIKCRYLEDSLINLDVSDPATRAHLPVVVGEVRKYLTKFLAKYPSHVANRRVTLIVMAADNLLK